MLAPDSRTVATAIFRPPPGYRLDQAVLTTYTLDLETLLALPLGVLSRSDADFRTLLASPLLLFEALRNAARRFHVFVDRGGIAIPGTHRSLYAMLEGSVNPVRAPNGGVFHPKVWVARFEPREGNGAVRVRVGILSRNLTDDRSWDVALTSEASPGGEPVEASRSLSDLLGQLPGLATGALADGTRGALRILADETARTRFPPPAGFHFEPVQFHGLGLTAESSTLWPPKGGGWRLLAIAPFVTASALDHVRSLGGGKPTLVSRQEALDRLPAEALRRWGKNGIRVLRDDALAEPEETEDSEAQTESVGRPSGLHAKLIAVEEGYDVTWYVGSANLTHAALTGRNVEMMAAIRGRKGRSGGKSGRGIEPFREGGFLDLCAPYRRGKAPGDPPEVAAARQRLAEAEQALLDADLRLRCLPADDDHLLALEGEIPLPAGVECVAWPVSVSEDRALPSAPSWTWRLPETRLTSFVAFRLRVEPRDVDDSRLTRKLPATGLPDTRLNAVLRSLIDSPARLLEFLRALLGGLDVMADRERPSRNGGERAWTASFGRETLLEDLLRAASRDPERLKPIRQLIADLQQTEEGRKLLPDEFLAIWDAVDRVASGIAS